MRTKNNIFRTISSALKTLLCTLAFCGPAGAAFSGYDSLVLGDHPVGYWMLIKGYQSDASGHGMAGTYLGSGRGEALLPDGETASIFNGLDNYFEIPDNDYLEVTRTGILTIEAWMRPDVENFPQTEAEGYVHWMGKGTPSNYLWAARMYNKNNNASRPQRISGYCFNLSGGLGAGSYFQDTIAPGTWIHYVLVINTVNTSANFPTGYTKIYRDGILRDMDKLSDYNIVPGNGTAPMRVATRDLASFFKGAIGKVALYDHELTPAQISAHNSKMRNNGVPLAIHFNFLRASVKNDRLTVSWEISGMANTGQYLVQLSKDGREFATVDTVQSESYTDIGTGSKIYEYDIPLNRSVATLGFIAMFGLLGKVKTKRRLPVIILFLFSILGITACSKRAFSVSPGQKENIYIRIVALDKDGGDEISNVVAVAQ